MQLSEAAVLRRADACCFPTADCAFCLVAGGLGERLGYSGIKVSLPVEVTTKRTYLEVYAQHILGLQAASNALAGGEPKAIPLAIMTSDDTHARTEALLAANDNFGFAPGQVVLMKQEKVPSLMDNAARIALGEDGFSMQTKPHGHGDVHSLLHSTGLAQKWAEEGRRYVVFFQDTNALAFLVTLATIGVSANRGFQVNSVTVPRKAKDAMGAIARLVRSDGSAITCNVEYNQLEPLLLASGHAEGDANDASGFSPFPGNINQLVLSISEYAAVLKATGGAMPEFVNPKYADAEKTKFKKPTRLECMMQDYPKLLEPTAKVGFTTFAEWTFCPVKNATADAQKIAGKGVPMRCASEGEMTYYSLGQRIMQAAGCAVPDSGTLEVTGLTLPHPPHIVLYPSFMSTWQGALQRLSGGPAIEVAPGSTLVLDGPDISIQSLKLNGSLTIRAVPGAVVCVKDAVVANAGHELQPLEEDSTAPESLKIRGFDIAPTEEAVIVASAPGTFTVSGAVSTGVTTLS